MFGQSFAEEMDCGNFFDQIDDLIDFPSEDIDFPSDPNSFPSIWSTQPESLRGSNSVFSSKSNSDNSAELYVPFEEIVQLEWLSSFGDDSFSGGRTQSLSTNKKEDSSSTNTDSSSASQTQFRTSSPVSVLESSSSSSTPAKRGRPRTKRPRSVIKQEKEKEERGKHNDIFCQAAESRLVIRIPKHVLSEHNEEANKKKKTEISPALEQEKGNETQKASSPSEHQPITKCTHCEVTKTPQWRLGPMGPKTLCNACGVRYKSGRLFPEYRPAASPTFEPSLHSNSHKKVAEMRSMKCETGFLNNTETGMSDVPELIPNKNNIDQPESLWY